MLRTSITSFIAAEPIPAGARVKLVAGSSTQVELADEGDVEIGTALLHSGKSHYATGDAVGVALLTHPGTRTCIAGSAILAGAIIKRANDGKVNDTSAGDNWGVTLEAAEGDGDFVEVMHIPSLLTTVADAAVTTAKLADSNVTPAKLADSVADLIPSFTIAVANNGAPNGNAYTTLQLKDAQGNNLATRGVFEVWFAQAAVWGAPADLGTLTATTGTLLKEDTDDAYARVVTDANGTAVLVLDLTADGTVHAHASIAGLAKTASAAITGN